MTSPRSLIRFFLVTQLLSHFWTAQAAHPPGAEPILLKTDVRSFNHKTDFALSEDSLWSRPRNQTEIPWQPIAFDKNGTAEPIEIRADGANLMVRDSAGLVHYKKVLKESRKPEKEMDTSTTSSWSPRWFDFPLARRFSNPCSEHRLQLPGNTLLWSISHRGKFSGYFNDRKNRKHPEFAMVTTAYAVLRGEENLIHYADPYLIGGFSRKAWGPFGNFKIETLASSASTVFITGRLFHKHGPAGKTRGYTRLIDWDVLGNNPFLPGFFFRSNAANPIWEEVILPDELNPNCRLGTQTTIYQDGQGNNARVLMVDGWNPEGVYGVFSKHIDELVWKFEKL